jgi:hypothetical protein
MGDVYKCPKCGAKAKEKPGSLLECVSLKCGWWTEASKKDKYIEDTAT